LRPAASWRRASQAQLTAANQAIEERRRELETIVETIPSGVVTLDGAGMVLQSNRAFAALMGLREDAAWPREDRIAAARRVRRRSGRRDPPRQRMGAASTEMSFMRAAAPSIWPSPARGSNWPAARRARCWWWKTPPSLLRAQRQLAWKEVAQRVAHEIKNPLTPIALSAERIGSISTAASRLAQHHSQVQRGDSGLRGHAAHAGRPVLGAGAVSRAAAARLRFEPGRRGAGAVCRPARGHHRAARSGARPAPVLADPEAIRRALANLIDNAAEAMQGSLLRVLGVHTALSEDGAAVEVVSPTPATD
jgi:two-component system, NtrC family, nitrogen regulation sensor histidine kinase NtrY